MSTLPEDPGGWRTLGRTPIVSLVAGLSLALAIGALTGIFAVVDNLLLEPLPFRAADRLAFLWETDPDHPEPPSAPTFQAWRQEARAFEGLAGLQPTSFSLTDREVPETPFSRRVTASYFELFDIAPIFGRVFTEEEEANGAKVVVLSADLWQRQYGGDPEIIGRTIELDYVPYTVLGVASFVSPIEPAPVALWAPLTLDPDRPEFHRRVFTWGRRSEDVSWQEAREDLSRIVDDLRRRHPEIRPGSGAHYRIARDMRMGGFRRIILTLLGVGSVVFLVVCFQAAHGLWARAPHGSARPRGRSGEILILVLGAAGAGVVLAALGLGQLRGAISTRYAKLELDGIGIDFSVLFFALSLALVAALVLGLVTSRASASGPPSLLRGGFVVVQVALALLLLIGAGLLIRTSSHLDRQSVGRDPEDVLTVRLSVRGADFSDPARRVEFFQQVQDAVSDLPGVEAVGATTAFPLTYLRRRTTFSLPGTAEPPPASDLQAVLQAVTPTYFEAVGLPLLEGSPFGDQDSAEAPGVAIVNKSFAERFFEDGSPIGRQVRLAGNGSDRRIAGVVADVRIYDRPPDPVPTLYVPHAQMAAGTMSLIVRTGGDPESLIPGVRAAVADLDRLPSVYEPISLARSRAQVDWQSRFSTVMIGFFALLVLIQAVAGFYAVIAPAEGRGRGPKLAASGLGLGLVLSMLLMPRFESRLFGVSGTDPSTYVVATLLLAAALAAAGLLARRARAHP